MSESDAQKSVDTEMNTGVSDTDVASPLQAEGTYVTGETTTTTEAADLDGVDTEMNTGVSDTDEASPQQADGTYVTGETTGTV